MLTNIYDVHIHYILFICTVGLCSHHFTGFLHHAVLFTWHSVVFICHVVLLTCHCLIFIRYGIFLTCYYAIFICHVGLLTCHYVIFICYDVLLTCRYVMSEKLSFIMIWHCILLIKYGVMFILDIFCLFVFMLCQFVYVSRQNSPLFYLLTVPLY